MRATANFRLSKSTKRIIASMLPPKSHEFKNAMIGAELAASVKIKSAKEKTSE